MGSRDLGVHEVRQCTVKGFGYIKSFFVYSFECSIFCDQTDEINPIMALSFVEILHSSNYKSSTCFHRCYIYMYMYVCVVEISKTRGTTSFNKRGLALPKQISKGDGALPA